MTSDLKTVIYSLHSLERTVLPFVSEQSIDEIISASSLSREEVMKGLMLLEQRGFVSIEKVSTKQYVLDKQGQEFLKDGLPEIQVLKELDGSSMPVDDIQLDKQVISGALGILKREKLVTISKDENGLTLTPTSEVEKFLAEHKNPLPLFSEGIKEGDLSEDQKKVIKELSKRPGLIKLEQDTSYSISVSKEGKKIKEEFEKKYKDLDLIDVLDTDMLKKGSWKGKEFRHYDTTINVPYQELGRRHPMIEANNILQDVFVEMGFQEMEGPMVETAFWNMDSMWIPQDHPARDEQDTFYLEGSGEVDEKLMAEVKQMHEQGLKKTHTEEGEWSEETSKRLLLRTHSTSTTFRTIAKLGEKYKNGEDVNGKWFYIANNFRNEAVDATHLAEFYQGEGFIVGDDLSLADLMGFIKEYYAKLGIFKIKFKPTFNPYTEPSMEAHYYDPIIGKWYSLINSGIFRPETLKPFGLQGKTIIAWGMGASRVAALLANVQSMRDITGVTCDFEWLKTRPMMRREIVRK